MKYFVTTTILLLIFTTSYAIENPEFGFNASWNIAPYQKYTSTAINSLSKLHRAKAFTLSIFYRPVNSNWRTILSLTNNWGKYKDGYIFSQDGKYNSAHDQYHAHFYTTMLESNYLYTQHNKYNFYSGIGIGYTYAKYKTIDNFYELTRNILAIQITIIGCEFGGKIKVNTAFGWGAKGILQAGISCNL